MTKARKVGDLLRGENSSLAALVRGAQRQAALDKQFEAMVDTPIAQHVHVSSADDGLLILVADTSVWGHRIRYLAPAILEQVRSLDPTLSEIKIIVRPPRSEPSEPPPSAHRAQLGKSSASLIAAIAATCENPKLANILQRLSKVAQRPRSDNET